MKDRIINFLALFGSTGTLVCCAIPAALAVLGGTAILSYISVFP